MKTDSLFYRLFQTLPSIFLELIGQSPTVASNYEFRSEEIKQTAFRIDGLFFPTPGHDDQPIYFAEVQFQRDSDFYYRFFTEISLYLGQNKLGKEWRAVAVYPRRSLDPDIPIEYRAIVAAGQVQRVYLDELGTAASQSLGVEIVQLVIAPEATASDQARQLLAKARQDLEDEAVRRQVLELIMTVMVYKLPQKSRRELEEMLGLIDLKQTRVYQEAKEEGLQEGLQAGRQEGRQAGLQAGKLQGKLESVPGLLNLGLTVEQIAQVLGLEVELVRQASQTQSQQPNKGN